MYPNYPTYNPAANPMMANQMQPAMNRYGMQQPSYPQSGYQQPYPQTYNSFQQPANPTAAIIKGRIVTGVEEARAAQVDLDGTISYFPSPAENKIYVKYVGMDGIAVFNVYSMDESNSTTKSAVAPAPSDTTGLEALAKRVDAIENQLKGVIGNVQPATANATNEHGAAAQQ